MTTTPTYRSINLTATLLGIDRRLSIVILIAVFLVFRHFTFLAAGVVFGLLWSAAYWLTKYDPELVVIAPKALLQRSLYDPCKTTKKKGGHLTMSSRGSSGLLQDAGACADEIALLRFIDDITFETKLGDLGMILSLTGIDPDCRTDEVLTAFTRRYESAMRLFDDRFRLYSYVVKRSGATPPYRDQYPTEAATSAVHRRAKALEARAGSIYETRLYLAVLYEGFRPRKKMLGSLQRATTDVAAEAERALEILGGTVRSFQSLMDDLLATEVLQEREVRLFLRCLVNYDPAHAAAFHMEAGGRLDTTTIDSQVDVYADHLRVNDFFLKSISLKQLPGATAPHLLFDLLSIDSDLIVCAEWKPKSNLHMRRVIRAKQTGFDALFINLAALALHGRGVPKSELPRKHEVEAHYDSLGASMQEIENRGNYFGGFACTVILIGRSLNRVRESVSQVVKVFGRWDASLIDERLNLFPSWLSILPGNYRHSRRYQYLLNVSYADMALIWASYTGDKRNPHLEDEYLCTFETPDRQLFYLQWACGRRLRDPDPRRPGIGKIVSHQLPHCPSPKVWPVDDDPRYRAQLPRSGRGVRRLVL